MQLRRYSEMMSISMPLMDCCTARTVMACGKRSFLLPAEQDFSDHAACALVRVLRKNSAKRQKKNGSVWNAFSVEKAHGLQDRRLYDCTFANDNGKTPGLTAKAKRYVEHWEDAARKNIGLLLFGDVGTGKSFLAGCIANALLEQDVPVLMTNFPTILNRMTGLFGSERADFLASLNAYDLLILDDLGAERGTEYALEQVFAVIDARYRSRKPLVVTTNLTLDALKHPDDLSHARIYDRILEICAPILFGGENLRVEKAN